jgi:4'-phosphopantetheinyl transferase
MTELWLVDLEEVGPALEALERQTPRLSSDDRQRAMRLSDLRDRRHRLAAYTALRIALERAAGPQVRGVAFVHAPGGKPSLAGMSPAFSLSHTQGVALIGVAPSQAIGVDVETARTIRISGRRREEIVAAAAGFASTPFSDPAPDSALLQAWARLEAYAKAQGQGLARLLQDLGLRAAAGRKLSPLNIEAAARDLAQAAGLEVRDVRLPPDLHGAVAVQRGTSSVRLRRFPADLGAIRRLLTPGDHALARSDR